MRYVYLAAAAFLFALAPSVASAQRVPFKDGDFTKDGSNNLVCEVDAATADGIEFKFTPQGDLLMVRSGGFGSTTAASASCITRDAGTDQLYGDKDCDQVKDAGEEFLDLTGAGTGAPTGAEYILGESNGSLTGARSPSAANQVPVSSSSSNAAWGTIPTAAIANEAITESKLDAENLAANGQILAFNSGTGRLRWNPPDSAVFSPISPPIVVSGAHAAGAAAYPMQKGIVTKGLWNHFELNTITEKQNAWVDIWVGNYADAVAECNSGASVGRFFRLLNANDCNGTGGIAGATCECRAISPSTYALASTVSVGDQYLWASTVDGSANGYFYDHGVVDWQDPWIKLEAATPGDCFSTVMVQKGNAGDFSLAWNPGSTVQTIQDITLSDDTDAGITGAESEVQATIAFSGWIDRDPDEWGTTHYLNPLATTPETVFQNAGNVMGVMWWKNKFYQVWRRVGTTTISVLEDLTDNFKLTPACGGVITPPATYSFCQKRHIMTFSLYNAWGAIVDNPFMRAAFIPGLSPAAGSSWNAPDDPNPATGTPLHNTQATRAMTVCNQKFYTVATLPACTAGYASVKIAVNDATSDSTCTGGGSTVNTCNCNGSIWVDSGGSPPNAEGFFSRHYAVQGYIGN